MITNQVINEAIEYILYHIEEELTLEKVSEHCHFSKYYFGRVFKEQTAAYQSIFLVWLPRKHYEIDTGKSMFDVYHKIDSDTMYMEMDICLPIK